MTHQNKLIWQGKPSSFIIYSSEKTGYVNGCPYVETIKNIDDTYTKNTVFNEFLPKFQGNIALFTADDYWIGEIESTHEYYDYVVSLQDVIKVEQRTNGDLEITLLLFRNDEKRFY